MFFIRMLNKCQKQIDYIKRWYFLLQKFQLRPSHGGGFFFEKGRDRVQTDNHAFR